MAIEERRTTITSTPGAPTAATTTTTTTGGGKSHGFLYFTVGALIVAVGVLAWMFCGGQTSQPAPESAIERAADAVGDAARSIPTPQPGPAVPPAPVVPPN